MLEIIGMALVKYGPGFARELLALFQKKDVTPADWERLFAMAEKSYEDYTKPIAPI